MGFWHDLALKLREQLQKSWLGKWGQTWPGEQVLQVQEVASWACYMAPSRGVMKKIHGHLDGCITSM